MSARVAEPVTRGSPAAANGRAPGVGSGELGGDPGRPGLGEVRWRGGEICWGGGEEEREVVVREAVERRGDDYFRLPSPLFSVGALEKSVRRRQVRSGQAGGRGGAERVSWPGLIGLVFLSFFLNCFSLMVLYTFVLLLRVRLCHADSCILFSFCIRSFQLWHCVVSSCSSFIASVCSIIIIIIP